MYRYPGNPSYVPNPHYCKVTAKEVETDLLDAEEIEVDGFVVENITTTNLTSTNNYLTHITAGDIVTTDLTSANNILTNINASSTTTTALYAETVDIGTQLNVMCPSSFTGEITLNALLRAYANVIFYGTLYVSNTLSCNSDLNVSGTINGVGVVLTGNLNGVNITITGVLDASTVYGDYIKSWGNLDVVSTIQAGVKVHSLGSIEADTTLLVKGSSLFKDDVIIEQDLEVDIDTRLGRDLSVTRNSLLYGNLKVYNDFEVNNEAYFRDLVTLYDDITGPTTHKIFIGYGKFHNYIIVGKDTNLLSTYNYGMFKVQGYDSYIPSAKECRTDHYDYYNMSSTNYTRIYKHRRLQKKLKYTDSTFYSTTHYMHVDVYTGSVQGTTFSDRVEAAMPLITSQDTKIFNQVTDYDCEHFEESMTWMCNCYWKPATSSSYPLVLSTASGVTRPMAVRLDGSYFTIYGPIDTNYSAGDTMERKFRVTYEGNVYHYDRPVGTGTDLEINTYGKIVRNTSSKRCKRNFQKEGDDYGDWILKLDLLSYNFNPGVVEDEKEGFEVRFFGPMAEDIHEHHPPAAIVNADEGLVEGIYSPELRHAMLAVIQKQDKKIKSLEARLDALEACTRI